jgi:hypothetical protein
MLALKYKPPQGALHRNSAFVSDMRIWTSVWWLSPGGGRTLEHREYSDSMSGLKFHDFEYRECACAVRASSEEMDLPLNAAFAAWNKKKVLFEDGTWKTPRSRNGVV